MDTSNTISIIITTFNGQKYVLPLLESLRHQTRKPDEVLIFDDRSQDLTYEFVEKFIHDYQLPWKLFQNPSNLGWRSNYMQGFEFATGDLLFPCDQDDIWEMDKLETMASVMKENDNINLLMTNYSILVETSDNKIDQSICKPMLNDRSVKLLSLREIDRFSRPGCVFCFRQSFFNEIKDYWIEDFAHDEWIRKCAIAMNSAMLINYISIVFRRHSNNNSPVFERTRIQKRKRYLQLARMYHQINLCAFPKNHRDYNYRTKHLENFYQLRKEFLDTSSFVVFLKLTRYMGNYKSIREFFGDILLSKSLCEKPSIDES